MDDAPIIRKYGSFDGMKADEYRYWQRRPAYERLDAVEEMIQTAYELKGWEIEPDVPRLQRPFVRLPVPWRKYLIVGGYAIIFHAEPRFTKELLPAHYSAAEQIQNHRQVNALFPSTGNNHSLTHSAPHDST